MNIAMKRGIITNNGHGIHISDGGIELGNAQNGTVDLGRFSLDNMESVTLYNGQK